MTDHDAILRNIAAIRAELDEIESCIGPKQEPETAQPPLYGRSAARDGLLRLATGWVRATYLREQSDHIREDLVDALRQTREQAPVRSLEQTFRLLNAEARLLGDDMDDRSGERRLEDAIFARWRIGQNDSAVPELWRGIAGKQVPLFDKKTRDGWGHIDLVAVGHDWLPVVVELKKGDNRECPLRALLEGVCYAVALDKAWHSFGGEYADLLESVPPANSLNLNADWKPKHVALMAPSGYWAHWRNGRGRDNRVTLGWPAFRQLVSALGDKDFNIDFWQCPDLDEDGKLTADGIQRADVPWNGETL